VKQLIHVAIAYDSPDNRRRYRLNKLLSQIALRVQWSLFECWLTESQLEDTWRQLIDIADPERDRIRLYRLCCYCRKASRILGPKELETFPSIWVV
jgi:CRISPR-associated protein Cas2